MQHCCDTSKTHRFTQILILDYYHCRRASDLDRCRCCHAPAPSDGRTSSTTIWLELCVSALARFSARASFSFSSSSSCWAAPNNTTVRFRCRRRHPGGEICRRQVILIGWNLRSHILIGRQLRGWEGRKTNQIAPPKWAGALYWQKIKIHGFDWLS